VDGRPLSLSQLDWVDRSEVTAAPDDTQS
jgi:hypothetical protein